MSQARTINNLVEPDSNWFQREMEIAKFTPDYYRLESVQYPRLFVCDELQQGHPQHALIKGDDTIRAGFAFTRHPFSMWKMRHGVRTVPIPLEHTFEGSPSGRIKGTLYGVRGRRYIDIDKHKFNGVLFQRKRVQLIMPCTELAPGLEGPRSKVHLVSAWMYVGVPEYWIDKIDGGFLFKPVRTFTPRSTSQLPEPYIAWTKLEYEDK